MEHTVNSCTLGGLILHELETFPEIGETVVTQRHTLVIEEVTERRIELVRVVVH